MKEHLPDTLLSRLSEFVADKIGLNFPKERWNDLERGVAAAAKEFEFKDTESYINWLIALPLKKDQIEILASHLTIGETYFFRDKRSYEILEGQILPDLIRLRQGLEKRLSIWSAGCCTGEEPYTIAILLSKMMPHLKDWNITILATDINPVFLKKAQDGIYGEWSFRDTPSWVKERYFKKRKDGRFEILTEIKKMVNFSYLNLAEDVYPSLLNNTNAMDLIFCRNVLIYFTQERAKRVVNNLHRSLTDGGWLFVSPSEASHLLFSRFNTINFQDSILYRKQGLGVRGWGLDVEPWSQAPGLRTPTPDLQSQAPEFWSQVSESHPPITDPRPTPEFIELKPIEEARQASYDEALSLYEQGNHAEATEKILGMIYHGQADSKVIALLTRVYADQGKLTEALAWCEKAIEQDKLNPGLHYLRATILQEQGAVDAAIISLKRALYLDQDLVLAHFALGNIAKRQGREKESDRYFQNALMLLRHYHQDELLPESDGIAAGRLSEIIVTMTGREMVA